MENADIPETFDRDHRSSLADVMAALLAGRWATWMAC